MSDLSVTSTTTSVPPSSWAQRKALFDQLGQALQAGDLSAARTAFAALRPASAPEAPSQDPGGTASRNPFAALADALQKGDLAAAQDAFAQMAQRREHHHPRTEEAEASEAGSFKQMKALFDQLGQALQAGDLSGARDAFAALQARGPGNGPSSREGQGATAQGPFAALATALQKGDLTAAQEAFGQIQQARGHHHHHRGHEAGSTTPVTPPTTPPATATAPASTTPPASSGDRDGDRDGDGAKAQGARIDLTA
ncbi:MAG: hypothetical protein HXX12_11945 [Geothrix sp.]|uniref:hypothetical protein n=1 Tax=Geothrix sp. TaxID=1962974 RepID=UPI00185AE1DD|nr:hypothetical protein [Geothrix sp.]NWJ41667.1 hypothetical protein [Geothrix sp.]WIL20351.1 MAG: hypothetical protein QOZ81_002916 [Geothrix sp.]